MSDDSAGAALHTLLGYLDDQPLTQRIADLEHALEGVAAAEIPAVLDAYAVDGDLLQAALATRTRLGRINDLIHATAIALALPELLEPGEVLRRPSLAAGNDPTRRFDLETDLRIAEFKLSRWQGGSNADRKRQVFKDLVGLAAEGSTRRAEPYVLGGRPEHFLRTTTSKASWALNKVRAQAFFIEAFGAIDVPISTFVAGPGKHVEIVDLEVRLPELFAPLP